MATVYSIPVQTSKPALKPVAPGMIGVHDVFNALCAASACPTANPAAPSQGQDITVQQPSVDNASETSNEASNEACTNSSTASSTSDPAKSEPLDSSSEQPCSTQEQTLDDEPESFWSD